MIGMRKIRKLTVFNKSIRQPFPDNTNYVLVPKIRENFKIQFSNEVWCDELGKV